MKKSSPYAPQWFREKQSICSYRTEDLKENATKAERHILRLLQQSKIGFKFQKGFISGPNFCIVDFFIYRPYQICLEIDGGYHDTGRQKARDDNRTEYLENYRGFKVLRISNDVALGLNKNQLVGILDKKLRDDAADKEAVKLKDGF